MSGTRKKKTLPNLQEIFESIKDLLSTTKTQLDASDISLRPSIIENLERISNLAESFTDRRLKAEQDCANFCDILDQEGAYDEKLSAMHLVTSVSGVTLWNISGLVSKYPDDDGRALAGAQLGQFDVAGGVLASAAKRVLLAAKFHDIGKSALKNQVGQIQDKSSDATAWLQKAFGIVDQEESSVPNALELRISILRTLGGHSIQLVSFNEDSQSHNVSARAYFLSECYDSAEATLEELTPSLDASKDHLLWQYGDRHYHGKRWSQAAEWFAAGGHPLFKVHGSSSASKSYRKAALCYIEQREYSRSAAVIRSCPSNEAATHYLAFLIATYQAIKSMHAMVNAPDFDRQMLLLATKISHESEMKNVLLAILEALLTTLKISKSGETAKQIREISAEIKSCKARISQIIESNKITGDDELLRSQYFLHTLRVFEAEILAQLSDWDQLLKTIADAVTSGQLAVATYEAIADILVSLLAREKVTKTNWNSGKRKDVLSMAVLHATLDHNSLSLEKYARWLRAICTITLARNTSADRLKAIGYVEQAVSMMENSDADKVCFRVMLDSSNSLHRRHPRN
ncbi:hypothetical protein HHX47_DHR9000165 [Lentinula edodes]|nr:hypothetical protein HHX47_DHR9000165 [Lentinula edodes]